MTKRVEDRMVIEGVTILHTSEPWTTPDGFTHYDGIHKVKVTGADGKPWKGRSYKGRVQTFKGETAWMNAERLVHDVAMEITYAR